MDISLRVMNESKETSFDFLVVGKYYTAYGIILAHGHPYFLIGTNNVLPMWIPGTIFIVLDSRFPDGWGFVSAQLPGRYGALSEIGVSCVIGYEQLVEDFDHYIGVVERDESSISVFMRSKKLIDRWWDQNFTK